MATLSTSSTLLHTTYRTNPLNYKLIPSNCFKIPLKPRHFQTNLVLKCNNKKWGFSGMGILRAGEEENLVTEQESEQESEEGGEATVAAESEEEQQQPVSVPVSPSDKITMFFQADGTLNETAIPTVTEALEGTEGISDLKVQVLEGIATVELKKQTTVQATGVAANLVEIIQGSGFKLQTLNLGFEDEEEVLV